MGNGRPRVLIAAGALFSVVILVVLVLAVVFLTRGPDAVGELRRSIFHPLPPAPRQRQQSAAPAIPKTTAVTELHP